MTCEGAGPGTGTGGNVLLWDFVSKECRWDYDYPRHSASLPRVSMLKKVWRLEEVTDYHTRSGTHSARRRESNEGRLPHPTQRSRTGLD